MTRVGVEAGAAAGLDANDLACPRRRDGAGIAVTADLRSRLAVAAVGVPAGVAAVYAGGWWLVLPLAGLAAWSAREFCRLALGDEADWRIEALGVVGASALVALAGVAPGLAAWGAGAVVLLVALVFAASGLAALWWVDGARPAASVSAAAAAAVYAGGTLSFAVFLRGLPDSWAGPAAAPGPWEGPVLALLPVAVVWTGDAAAYAVGRKAGRRKLAPRTSPGKTVEGAVAGLGASGATGWLAGMAFGDWPNLPVSPWTGLAAGLALGAAGQLGDLAESGFKRGARVKDSGSVLGGHGGVLDRFDGVYFAVPLAYGLALLARSLA